MEIQPTVAIASDNQQYASWKAQNTKSPQNGSGHAGRVPGLRDTTHGMSQRPVGPGGGQRVNGSVYVSLCRASVFFDGDCTFHFSQNTSAGLPTTATPYMFHSWSTSYLQLLRCQTKLGPHMHE